MSVVQLTCSASLKMLPRVSCCENSAQKFKIIVVQVVFSVCSFVGFWLLGIRLTWEPFLESRSCCNSNQIKLQAALVIKPKYHFPVKNHYILFSASVSALDTLAAVFFISS